MRCLKILVTTFLLLSFFHVNVLAQLGLRGGINLSKFVGADATGAEEVMGLNAGFSVRLINIGPVSIVPEIYYAEKGTRFSDQIRALQTFNPDLTPGIDNYELEFNLAYIEVPVLLRLNLPFLSTNVVHPYIGAGPVFAWRIECNFSFTSGDVEVTARDCADRNFPDAETAFKEADRGYVINSGIDFQVPFIGTLTLDARYTRGLERVRESAINNDIQNQSFTLMLGYTYDF